ncbi:TPA: plasmid SOS inhibition protein A [Klebsiella pneumoniae]|nr:plasmid SOS inhibition protein A [Klebsiella pneumoniae]HDZ9079581.1 plasmid SOS inhibition protein A [Klebsiella pneumoniae]
MNASTTSLVTLKPARQAALQAVLSVEESLRLGARLPAMPHVRTFLRLLTGNSRMNTTVAQRIPGLNWDPKHRLSSLKQVEEALDELIASHGECCPLPHHWRLRDAKEPLYGVIHEIGFIVRDTPEAVRQAERWQVPNKLTDRRRG